MRKYFLILVMIICYNGVFSQTDTTDFKIEIYYGSENNRIWFCSDSVLVAPEIKIEGDDFDGEAQGLRISISNYIKGEDLLVYKGSLNAFWNNDLGYLEFSSMATAKEYEDAVKQVYYKNEREIPQLGNRYISITLKDANYLPRTKHFYEFIKKDNGIAWTQARSDASKLSYYGLQGYLATITSKAENDFIAAKVSGVGWFGASDADVEGEWKWVTGPEAAADVVFWKGNETGIGTGYSKWGAGEPNNSGGNEDYAHLGHPYLEPKTWNDQGNGSGSITSIYSARGFIVEYGGMEGDPDLRLSASTIIRVEKIAFSNKRDFEICFGDSVTLNNIYPPSSNDSVYSWLPNEGIVNPNIYNPTVSPELTTVYTSTGKLGECETSADFTVKVNPIPVHKWDSENIICKGESIKLNPGVYESYLWGNMDSVQTLTVSEEDWYTVTLTNNFECTKTDSTQVKWSGFPKLDYGELDTLVCGEKQQKLNLSFQNEDINTQLIPFQTGVSVVDETSLSPTITVDNYGVYHFKMEMEDQYQCLFFDTLGIEFHNQPSAEFFLDTLECQGYNLDLEFTGTTIEPSIFTWFTSDSVFVSELDLFDVKIPLGYGERDRTVGLIVNEKGCLDSIKLPVLVTPQMNFRVEENDKGCTPLNVQFGNSNMEDIESYIWNFGDGDSAFVEKPTHTYLNQDTVDLVFDVELSVVSAEGCTNTGVLDKAVVVHPIPTIDFSFEESICYSEKETVWYKGSGNENDTYIWDL